MRMKRPTIYEEWPATASLVARRKQIAGGYEPMADGAVGFYVDPHDPGATLVLDPSLSVAYTTFLGGAGADVATSIALGLGRESLYRRHDDFGDDFHGNRKHEARTHWRGLGLFHRKD